MERYTISAKRGNLYVTTASTASESRKIARQLFADGYRNVEVDFSPSADFAYDLRWTWGLDGGSYNYTDETWRYYK